MAAIDGNTHPRHVTLSQLAAIVLTIASAGALASATTASAQGVGSELADVEIGRYEGADRYETSLLIAEEFARRAGGTLEHAVMVSGRHWTDVAVAASYASRLGAPILLAPPDGVRDEALQFLKRVGVKNVHFVTGGERPDTNVSPQVTAQLGEAGFSLFGFHHADQYSLGVEIARWFGQPESLSHVGPSVIVANGEVFADALVAGPLSYHGRVQVLLTPRDELHPAVADYLREADIAHVVLMGGTAALSADVESAIGDLGVAQVDRLAGGTRYETATKAAEYAAGLYAREELSDGCFNGSSIGLARGDIPFDALSSAPLLSQLCAPLVLTEFDKPSPSTARYLAHTRHDWHDYSADAELNLIVLGGTAAVSQQAVDGLIGATVANSEPDVEASN